MILGFVGKFLAHDVVKGVFEQFAANNSALVHEVFKEAVNVEQVKRALYLEADGMLVEGRDFCRGLIAKGAQIAQVDVDALWESKRAGLAAKMGESREGTPQ